MKAKPWNELSALPEPGEESFRHAHRRLMKSFEDVRTLCAWIEAPFGRLFLARTRRGLCRVSFRRSEAALLADLERHQLLPEMAPEKLDRERSQLEAYFRGRNRRFELPVDLRWGTAFERQVLQAAQAIPFGRVESYAEIARRIRRPRAQRAVGNALGKNPIAIVIPCHRVVASGGKLGGYTGGLDVKRLLLSIEGIRIEEV
jgi:methylated-DNA-[protein]-cysteine S-methyltransferase